MGTDGGMNRGSIASGPSGDWSLELVLKSAERAEALLAYSDGGEQYGAAAEDDEFELGNFERS